MSIPIGTWQGTHMAGDGYVAYSACSKERNMHPRDEERQV